jgi:hypothetical protein
MELESSDQLANRKLVTESCNAMIKARRFGEAASTIAVHGRDWTQLDPAALASAFRVGEFECTFGAQGYIRCRAVTTEDALLENRDEIGH